MSTKLNTIFVNEVLKYAQREFDVQETFKLLVLTNPNKYMSWGVSRKYGLQDMAVLFEVNGNHHQGWVLVILAWNDTYSFYLFDDIRTIKYEQHQVYFDELQTAIDLKIEYISDYEY